MIDRCLPALVAALLLIGGSASADPAIGETSVFARIGEPGEPEGIVVHGDRVYVGTHAGALGNGGIAGIGAAGPSRITVFDLESGAQLHQIVIEGQDLDRTHGLLALTTDAAGRLYALDRAPARILRFDPATFTQETYAVFPELTACRVDPQPPCTPTTLDEPAFPNVLAFTADGTAYVTDLQGATIYRVPAGGGTAEVWYQDARFDGVFGTNGIAVTPEQDALVFAVTGSQQPATFAQAIIYRLPIVEQPTAEQLETVHVFPEPAAGADGIRFGASGKLYVALAGANQIAILDLDTGQETRFPSDPIANAQQEIPYDTPVSLDFDDARRSILVTNHAYFTSYPGHWAVLRAFVDDTGGPRNHPALP